PAPEKRRGGVLRSERVRNVEPAAPQGGDRERHVRERGGEAAVAQQLLGQPEGLSAHDLRPLPRCPQPLGQVAGKGGACVVDERDSKRLAIPGRHSTRVRWRTLPAAIPSTSAAWRTACPGISATAVTRACSRRPRRREERTRYGAASVASHGCRIAPSR